VQPGPAGDVQEGVGPSGRSLCRLETRHRARCVVGLRLFWGGGLSWTVVPSETPSLHQAERGPRGKPEGMCDVGRPIAAAQDDERVPAAMSDVMEQLRPASINGAAVP
jgi:hypothetical protein